MYECIIFIFFPLFFSIFHYHFHTFSVFNKDNIEGYVSGGQSELTNDPAVEEAQRLVNKINLTPSDAHKVVIQVSDTDAEIAKGKK